MAHVQCECHRRSQLLTWRVDTYMDGNATYRPDYGCILTSHEVLPPYSDVSLAPGSRRLRNLIWPS